MANTSRSGRPIPARNQPAPPCSDRMLHRDHRDSSQRLRTAHRGPPGPEAAFARPGSSFRSLSTMRGTELETGGPSTQMLNDSLDWMGDVHRERPGASGAPENRVRNGRGVLVLQTPERVSRAADQRASGWRRARATENPLVPSGPRATSDVLPPVLLKLAERERLRARSLPGVTDQRGCNCPPPPSQRTSTTRP